MYELPASISTQTLDPRDWQYRSYTAVAGLLGLAVVPNLIDPSTVLVLISMFYFAIFVMSWDIVSGYTGQFSFGHTFIFAIGDYTSAILNLDYGLAPMVSIPLGTLAAVLAGILFGAPALRLKGPYFAILTFLLPTILQDTFIFFNDTFGGSQGLSPPDELIQAGGLRESIMMNYYLGLAAFLAVLVLLLAVTRSRIGERFSAIREDEAIVANAGFNPAKYKILAFALSSAIGGFGAALYVHTPVGSPTPTQLLALSINIEIIFAAVIGGLGTVGGAAVGGLVFYLLDYYVGSTSAVVPVLDLPLAEYDFVLFSLLILVLLYRVPEGILPRVIDGGEHLLARLRRR